MTYTNSFDCVTELVMDKGGATLVGVWLLCCGQSEDFMITMPFLKKRLRMNEKTVAKYVQMLAEIGLAKLVRVKDSTGRWQGSQWLFANFPQGEWLNDEQMDFFTDDGEVDFTSLLNPVAEDITTKKDKTINNKYAHHPDAQLLRFPNAQMVADTDQSQAKAVLSVKTEKPEKRHSADEKHVLAAFAAFYEVYPRKLDKKRAMLVFKRLTSRKTPDELTEFTEMLTRNVLQRTQYDAQWLRSIATNMATIPYPKAYLSGERWHDKWEVNLAAVPKKTASELETFIAMGGTIDDFLTEKQGITPVI